MHVLQDSEPAENEDPCDHDEAEEGGFMNTGEEWGTDDDEVENTVSGLFILNTCYSYSVGLFIVPLDENFLLPNDGKKEDYYPFKSQQEMLLYILVNSPRPVVS